MARKPKPEAKPTAAALEVRRLPVSQINPAPYNPRVALKPGDPEYEKLKRSLTEFGCAEPPVWNKSANRKTRLCERCRWCAAMRARQ